jgi:hypothetical protein
MAEVFAQSDRSISAPPSDVFTFLSDYNQRPRILPANFSNYAVEQGGTGAGTVVSYRFSAGRSERHYRMQIQEPSPGAVLQETDTDSSFVTTWSLSPGSDERTTLVSLASRWQGATGVAGFFERLFAPLGLRRIYSDMLARLADAVEQDQQSSQSAG